VRGAPFSVTERFMSRTAITSASVTAAKTQKLSADEGLRRGLNGFASQIAED
jgi:hypothetical protein